jgi:hypothetical protein
MVAMLLDHTMSPDADVLPPQCLDECRIILERCYEELVVEANVNLRTLSSIR